MWFLNYLSSVKWPWAESHKLIGLQRYIVIGSAICLSIILSGKGRCFGVVLAHLENKTCASTRRNCSISFLNLIGDLAVAITLVGSPFVTGFLIKIKSPALGGRISVQSTILVLLGCLSTMFVIEPDSLLVTDSIIQGMGASVLVSVLAIRLIELFPREHKYHVLVSAFTDAGPWGTMIMCPLFGVILQTTHWQQVYLFFSILLSVVVLVTSIVEPKVDIQPMQAIYRLHEPHKLTIQIFKCTDHSTEPAETYEEVNEIEFWENEQSTYSVSSDERSDSIENVPIEESVPHATGFKEFFFSSETKNAFKESTTILWLIERAIHTMVLYNIVLNLVNYMVVEINENLEKASLIMMSFGGGEVIGFVIAAGVGDQLRHHLLHIYTISTAVLAIILMSWHISQAMHLSPFSNGDAHFLALICGIAMAFTNGYTYSLAEDIINRPGFIAYPLTRFFQAFGLILAPITSGLIIQYDRYNSFFLVQMLLTVIRFVLLCALIYKMKQKRMIQEKPCICK